MLVFFARSGARHPVLPVALGLVLGGSLAQPARPRPARPRDRLPRLPLLAGVQPRRRLHRRRRGDPLRRARRAPTARSAGRRAAWPLSAFAPLRPSASTGRVAGRPEVGSRVARRAADRRRRRARRRRAPGEEPPARGRGGRRRRAARRGRPARRGGDGPPTSPGRTSTCSSSTSPPASSSIPAPATEAGTLVHGLLAHDAAGGDEDRPGIVHRLDRDTSGLLVVARSDEAHERLQEPIRRRAGRAALPRAREGLAALALAAGSRRRSAATGSTRRATRSTRRRRATR